MPRPKIIEVDYHQFASRLRKATNAGHRLEKVDQPAWDDFVSAHNVNEVAMSSWGRSKFTKIEPVIINDGGSWEGYYVYSKDDEACLKWTVADD
jgi:hypothetical protein